MEEDSKQFQHGVTGAIKEGTIIPILPEDRLYLKIFRHRGFSWLAQTFKDVWLMAPRSKRSQIKDHWSRILSDGCPNIFVSDQWDNVISVNGKKCFMNARTGAAGTEIAFSVASFREWISEAAAQFIIAHELGHVFEYAKRKENWSLATNKPLEISEKEADDFAESIGCGPTKPDYISWKIWRNLRNLGTSIPPPAVKGRYFVTA